MMARITLPWPSRLLSPNGSHGHWAPKARAKKDRRDATRLLVLAQVPKREFAVLSNAESVRLRFEFAPPDRRERDVDNVIASLKSTIDGIADAIQVDDSRFQVQFPRRFEEPVRGGEVRIDMEVAS